eukprot:3082488-Pyramimonas_sp.AAC.1
MTLLHFTGPPVPITARVHSTPQTRAIKSGGDRPGRHGAAREHALRDYGEEGAGRGRPLGGLPRHGPPAGPHRALGVGHHGDHVRLLPRGVPQGRLQGGLKQSLRMLPPAPRRLQHLLQYPPGE